MTKAVIFDLFETLVTEWGHEKYTQRKMCWGDRVVCRLQLFGKIPVPPLAFLRKFCYNTGNTIPVPERTAGQKGTT